MAQARLSPRGQEAGLYSPLVRAKLPDALNLLANRIQNDPKRRLLQKTFDFVIDVPTQSADVSTGGIEAVEPLLLPYDPYTGNYIAFPAAFIGNTDLYHVADRKTLINLRLNYGRVYYTVRDQTLFLNSQNKNLSGSVSIVGNYVPVINQTLFPNGEVESEDVTLPPELLDEIVETLTALFDATAMQQQQQIQPSADQAA